MAAQHTAKPLAWEEGTSDITADWAGRKVVIATVRAPDWHENQVCGGREAGANAALFAAAPDLLAEVRRLDDLAKHVIAYLSARGDRADVLHTRAHNTRTRIKALVAKAEGRS